MATKIKNSNLDNTIITGLTTTEDVATTDQAIIYDASTGSLRKITQQNLLGFPTITSVSPTSVNSGDGTGNHTFVITGAGFTGASSNLIKFAAFRYFHISDLVLFVGSYLKSAIVILER